MHDSPETIRMLRARIADVERARARDAPLLVPTGHAVIDAAIGGGIMRARLHEIFAETIDDSGSAAGFAAMLCVQLARPGATIFWLREQAAEARGGCLHAPGLAELGIDPGRVILGVMDDALGLLRVAGEVVRCPDIDVAVIELWKNPRVLDLTASRRLAVAAQGSGVTALMLRADAEPGPSAAQTRWSVASAIAAPLEASAPGYPTFELNLLRQRGGSADRSWQVEWNRDQGVFREAAFPRAVVPLSVGGPLATGGERSTG
ncbi:ImuA family protein [Sphingomonas sp. 28-63-12]|uniref:ImuA family protein n=1 Tax=Sphingomonas sp. 28-63-12 TaxID=1970434 RepID=UPI000BD5F47A|nr:MAG: hypothetical protein B7Y47_15970 [Sphingomonas sp. 28-63-12]